MLFERLALCAQTLELILRHRRELGIARVGSERLVRLDLAQQIAHGPERLDRLLDLRALFHERGKARLIEGAARLASAASISSNRWESGSRRSLYCMMGYFSVRREQTKSEPLYGSL